MMTDRDEQPRNRPLIQSLAPVGIRSSRSEGASEDPAACSRVDQSARFSRLLLSVPLAADDDLRRLDGGTTLSYGVGQMGRDQSVGQFEQVVLTAVLSLREDAYGVRIHARVAELSAPKIGVAWCRLRDARPVGGQGLRSVVVVGTHAGARWARQALLRAAGAGRARASRVGRERPPPARRAEPGLGRSDVETGPHPLAERVVARLLPPPCREHVLGDLYERNATTGRYVRDALRSVPFAVWGQVRRTTSPGLACLQAGAVCTGGFLSAYGRVAPGVLQTTDGVLGTVTPALAAVVVLALRDAWTGRPQRMHPRARRRAALRGHRVRGACGGRGISHPLARRLDGHDDGRRGESAAPFARPYVPRPGEHSDHVRSVRRLRYAGPSLRWLVQPPVGALAVGVGAAGRGGRVGRVVLLAARLSCSGVGARFCRPEPPHMMPVDLRPHLVERLDVASIQVLNDARLERIIR